MDPTVDNYYASNGKVPSRLRLVVVSSGSCRRSEVEAGASPSSWWREEEDPPAPAWPRPRGVGLRPLRPAAASSAHRCAAVVSPPAVVSAPPSVSAGPREVGRLPLRLSAVSSRHRRSVVPPEEVVATQDLVVVLLLSAPRRHGPRGPAAAAAAAPRRPLWCRAARLPPQGVPSGAVACSPLLRPLLGLAWWCGARTARVVVTQDVVSLLPRQRGDDTS